MKKSFIYLFFGLICMVMPLFVACTGTGGTDVQGVRFYQSEYEVDLNTPINLNYMIYPNTAKDYNVTFVFKADYPNFQQLYTFKDGMFTITSKLAPEFRVSAVINGDSTKSDTCTIKLKKYPTKLSFGKENYKVNAGGVCILDLNGVIDNKDILLLTTNYNIELVSSNPSVLKVEQNSLAVISTGLSGSATIQARVKDASGNYIKATPYATTELFAETTLTVVDNVDYALATLEGEDEFLKLSTDYTQAEYNTYSITSNSTKLGISLFSAENKYINNSGVQIFVSSANPSVAEVIKLADGSNGMQYFSINFKTYGTARIEITSTATDVNGNPVKFIFYASYIK